MVTDKQKHVNSGSAKVKQGMSETLKEAKKYLKRGDLTKIAEEVGVVPQTVTDVIAGKFKNFEVFQKILEKAEHNKGLLTRGSSI
jgi:hypothetical protein